MRLVDFVTVFILTILVTWTQFLAIVIFFSSFSYFLRRFGGAVTRT